MHQVPCPEPKGYVQIFQGTVQVVKSSASSENSACQWNSAVTVTTKSESVKIYEK